MTSEIPPLKARRAAIPGLTGLRFVAAFSVAIAHGTDQMLRFDHPAIRATYWLPQAAGFGMTFFFVLSGFVIHYNYRLAVTEGGADGISGFAWARFARLYPLYAFVIVLDIVLGRPLYQFVTGNAESFSDVIRALPFYLTFTQSWIYVPFTTNSLIYQVGANSSLTWSISTEWFFYLSYPFVALLVMRARHPLIVGITILVWCIIWASLAHGIYGRAQNINSWAIAHYGAIATAANGNQDSFFRWLMYFSPYLRIGEFILGCLTAQLYVLLQDKVPTVLERDVGQVLMAIGIVSLPVVTYLMFVGNVPFIQTLNYNFGLAPSVALILFCGARYKTFISYFLDSRPVVALGEASYSMYLFHFLIFNLAVSLIGGVYPGTPRYIAYLLSKFLFLLATIMLVALGFHNYLEVPARRWLRGLWRRTQQQHRSRLFAYLIFSSPAIAALLVSVGLPALPKSQTLAVKHGIRVLVATYGANCQAHEGNATREIVKACSGKDSCHYTIDVGVLGDPAPGCQKDFTVDYQCVPNERQLGAHVAAEAGLGSHLDLSCKPGSTSNAAVLSPNATVKPMEKGAADTPVPSGIEVQSATYGGNCGAPAGNVTADVQMICNDDQECSYKIDGQRLGDPAPKCGKDFSVDYTCRPNGRPIKVEVAGEAGFGAIAQLRCPGSAAVQSAKARASTRTAPLETAQAPGIHILAATYGGNCGARVGNASQDVKKVCEGSASCDYRVSVDTLGDPDPGCSKSYFVKYQCGGASPRSGFARGEAGRGSLLHLSCK